MSGSVQRRVDSLFPIGTLVVNMLGSLLIGFVLGASIRYGVFTRSERLFLATGFAGSFTTFSTFSYETLVLLSREPLYALANMIGNLALGLGLVYLGYVLAGVAYG